MDGGWPKDVATSVGTFTVYQPQIDAFDGLQTSLYAALALTAKEDDPPAFGVAWFEARTDVDKLDRLVHFSDVTVNKISFPSSPDKEALWLEVIQTQVSETTRTMALDQFEAALEVVEADKNVRALPLKNDPPRIVFSTQPAILAYIDGEPTYRSLQKTKLQRSIREFSSCGTRRARLLAGLRRMARGDHPPIRLDGGEETAEGTERGRSMTRRSPARSICCSAAIPRTKKPCRR